MNKETGFAPINGTQMYYEIAGSGHPLIMVHAGVADHRLWDDQFDLFAKNYRVIRFDQRGFGQTKPVDGEFRRSEDIYALLTHLGISQTYLMGCSMGGGACIDFALTHHHMAKALITIGSGPSGFKTDNPPPPIWDELVKADEAGDIAKVAEYEAQIWLDGPYAPAGRVGGAVREKMIAMNTIALNYERLDLGKQIDLAPPAVNRLGELHLPALIIYGDLDTPHTQAAGKFMAQNITGAQLVIMPGAAHLPSIEQPEALNKIVLDFLTQLSG